MDERNRDAVFKYLGPVLRSARKAGRFYYVETCKVNDPDPLPFPQLTVYPSSNGKKGIDAVHEMFAGDKRVRVIEGGDSIIRVYVGNVSTALLETKVSLVRFNPDERYTPEAAILAIMNTKEVETAGRKLGLERPPTVYSINVRRPAEGLSHLPASIKNLTVEQVLDIVASTFRGVVVYGECITRTGAHFYKVDVVELDGIENKPSRQ